MRRTVDSEGLCGADAEVKFGGVDERNSPYVLGKQAYLQLKVPIFFDYDHVHADEHVHVFSGGFSYHRTFSP
jgi:hypothetical protein